MMTMAIFWPALNTLSGLDINVIGSVLVNYDVADEFMNVDDPRVRKTMEKLEEIFAAQWPVNIAWKNKGYEGMGLGRFPEDANDGKTSKGGNPWTFATLWGAQYYLRLIQRYDYLGKEGAGEFSRKALLKRADGYLQFVLANLEPGDLTEQIDGQAGGPRGAHKLSWSHTELINLLLIRKDVKKRNPLL